MAEEIIVAEVTEQAQEPANKPNERKFSKNGSRPRTRRDNKANEKVSDGIDKKMVNVNRISKTVKGGRKMRFNAIVVAGDRNGRVGVGMGKANEVPEAIRKGIEDAKKNLIEVPVVNGTIPHELVGRYGAARVMMRPAAEGTGVIAGGAVRAVVELAGIKNILAKSLGSDTSLNIVKATVQGLGSMKRVEDVARLRGKSVEEILG